jgi:hypothetical protein
MTQSGRLFRCRSASTPAVGSMGDDIIINALLARESMRGKTCRDGKNVTCVP